MSELDPAKTALSRAISSCAAISASRLFGRRHKLFGTRQWWFLGREYETLWPFADAWSALCTFGSLPDQHQALMLLDAMTSGLRFYSNERDILESTGDAGFESVVTPPLGSGGDRFYDDNAWLGLALVSHHELSGNPALLRLAQRVFGFVVSGWSTDPTWHVPGGIRWKEPTSNRSRNTCVNGPAAELAARLHGVTGDESYVQWAIRIYDWTRRALLNADALYVDQVAPDGALTPTIWSYNQGSMIGAGVLITQATSDSSFLDQSLETAAAYVGSQGVSDLMNQDPAFNAVFFRNLLMLPEAQFGHQQHALMAGYGSDMWERRRLRHGLFAGNGSPLNNTAAMVQIYSLMAGAQPHP